MCDMWLTRNRPLLEVTEPESDYFDNFYHNPDACCYTHTQALHKWIDGNLTPDDKVLYTQGVIDGKSVRTLASDYGSSKSDIHRRINKIKQIIIDHAEEIQMLVTTKEKQ